MPHIPFHPAPGLGDLMPGSFVVPSNPIRDVGTPMVPSVQAANGNQVSYRPKMGELLPGAFPVPQNPIVRTLAGGGMGGMGCGGGCNGGTGSWDGGFHSSGLQGLDMNGVGSWLQEPQVAGIPGWGLLAAGVLAYMLFAPGGGDYWAARKSLDAQHRGYRRGASRIAS